MGSWKKAAALLLALSMCAITGLSLYAGALTEAEGEKQKLEEQLEETKDAIESLREETGSLEDAITQLDGRITEVADRMAQLGGEIAATEEEIAAREAQLEQAARDEEDQFVAMKKRIKFMYERGNQSYLDLLCSAESISDMLNKADFVYKLTLYDREMLEKYRETKQYIARAKAELEERRAALEAMKGEALAEEEGMKMLMAAKEEELATSSGALTEQEKLAQIYEGEIQAQNEIIAQIREAERLQEQQRQEEARRAAQAQQSQQESGGDSAGDTGGGSSQEGSGGGAGQDDSYSGGMFAWPCPASRALSGDYGLRDIPIEGASANHNGIDIPAPYGSAIIAAESGKVLIAGYSSTAGNWVVISHGGGVNSVYMHASALLVSQGQTVSRGETIAQVGSTGLSTGNHLHFGVSLNGSYVNPWNYLQ